MPPLIGHEIAGGQLLHGLRYKRRPLLSVICYFVEGKHAPGYLLSILFVSDATQVNQFLPSIRRQSDLPAFKRPRIPWLLFILFPRRKDVLYPRSVNEDIMTQCLGNGTRGILYHLVDLKSYERKAHFTTAINEDSESL